MAHGLRVRSAHTIPSLKAIDDQVPFRFTGTIAKLTIKVGPNQLTEADHQAMQEALARAKD